MWIVWPGFKFRMELAGNEVWMIREFDDLDELPLDVGTSKDKAGLFEVSLILVVEFVTVTMTFGDVEVMVEAFREGVFFDAAWVSA